MYVTIYVCIKEYKVGVFWDTVYIYLAALDDLRKYVNTISGNLYLTVLHFYLILLVG